MYAVMRFAKLKTMGQIGALAHHNERTRETRNADAARLGDNVRLAGSGDWCADVQARLDTVPTIRANAVLALEYVMTASRAFFERGDEQERAARLAEWTERSMAWLRGVYGAENVVAAVLHKDEQTPHIQALVVPIDERGRLNAQGYIREREQVRRQQDGYAAAVRELGLERGVRGSVADHQTVKEFYAKIETPTPAPEIVKQHVEVERPSRLVGNPERYVAEQQEKIVARLAPIVDAALTKANHYEELAAKTEANNLVSQGQVRQLETAHNALREDYKALAAQARARVPLESVIERLGGQQDRYNAHKWRLDGEHISINGEQFYNHDRQQGGGGAIDLVMHTTGYDFREAVAYLRDTHGAEVALAAASWHTAREGLRQAQEIVERAERPPFHAPEPDEARWLQVRAYLTEQRALPAELVDHLHAQGRIYADHRANAVFLRTNGDGQAVGASLRGTLPGSDFKGLAAGTRRDEGHFSFTIGKAEMFQSPQVYLTESPIDALSRAALLLRAGERGEVIFVSTDGHGELPARQIDEGTARRALIHCAFDNDKGGETLWARVRERYPDHGAIVRDRPPTGCKDWNDALRRTLERQGAGPREEPAQQREHEHSHGHGGGRRRGREERDDRRL